MQNYYKQDVIRLELINLKPISTNHMYYSFARKGGKGTFKTKSTEYVKFSTSLQSVLGELISKNEDLKDMIKDIDYPTFPYLEIEVDIPIKDYQTKTGKLKSHDSSNFIKATEDSIFSYLSEVIHPDINDHMVIAVSSTKRVTELEFWIIRINLYLPNINIPRKEYIISHKFDN